MNRLIFLTLLLCCTSVLGGCHNASHPLPNQPDESIIPLSGDAWPDNDYTRSLPVPPGTLLSAAIHPEYDLCEIQLTDVTKAEFTEYINQLVDSGFSVLQSACEPVSGSDYTSDNFLLSNGTKGISISHIPDSLGMVITQSP